MAFGGEYLPVDTAEITRVAIGDAIKKNYKQLSDLLIGPNLLENFATMLSRIDVEISRQEDVWIQLHLMNYSIEDIAELTDSEAVDVEFSLMRLDAEIMGIDWYKEFGIELKVIEIPMVPQPVAPEKPPKRTTSGDTEPIQKPDITPHVPRKDMSFMDDGLCQQVDNEMFFPEKNGSTGEAKKVCARCDVRDECLQYALDNDERFGVWGGLSARERQRLKKRQQKSEAA